MNIWAQEEKAREAALDDDLRPVVYAIVRCLQRMDEHDGYPGDSDLLAYITQARERLAAPTALPKVDTTQRTVDALPGAIESAQQQAQDARKTEEPSIPEKTAIQKNTRKIQEAQAAQEREEAISLGRAAMRSLQAKPAPEGDFVDPIPEKATV